MDSLGSRYIKFISISNNTMNKELQQHTIDAYKRGMNMGFILGLTLVGFVVILSKITNYFLAL